MFVNIYQISIIFIYSSHIFNVLHICACIFIFMLYLYIYIMFNALEYSYINEFDEYINLYNFMYIYIFLELRILNIKSLVFLYFRFVSNFTSLYFMRYCTKMCTPMFLIQICIWFHAYLFIRMDTLNVYMREYVGIWIYVSMWQLECENTWLDI